MRYVATHILGLKNTNLMLVFCFCSFFFFLPKAAVLDRLIIVKNLPYVYDSFDVKGCEIRNFYVSMHISYQLDLCFTSNGNL